MLRYQSYLILSRLPSLFEWHKGEPSHNRSSSMVMKVSYDVVAFDFGFITRIITAV